MKIIRLGHYDITFMCLHCKTVYQFSTDEVKKNENEEWEIRCPICDTPIIMSNDEEIMKMLHYREDIENEIHKN